MYVSTQLIQPECFVHWSEPAHKWAWCKQEKVENWQSKRYSSRLWSTTLYRSYEVCQWTDNIDSQSTNICYN